MRHAVSLIAIVCAVSSFVAAQPVDDSTSAERVVEILNADSARATRVEGQPADVLIGHVQIRQGDTFLSAERAVRFKQQDKIIFRGSVSIIDKGDSLAADSVVYKSDVKQGAGSGNVRYSDGEVTITSLQGRYLVDEKIAEFEKDVEMQDSTTMVLSEFGRYDVHNRVATFHDDVYLEQRRLVLTAGSLTHERESGLTTAVDGVRIYRFPEKKALEKPSDEDNTRILLVADTATSERDTGMNRLTGHAGLVRIETDPDRIDTLVVRSPSVVVQFNDSTEAFDASEGVRFWRGRLAGHADSVRYTSISDSSGHTSSIRMLGDPFVWSSKAQVNGDTIDVRVQGGQAHDLQAYEDAYVGFQDTTHDFIQQLKGRRLEALFRNDSLQTLVVHPNAEALYFAADSTDKDSLSVLHFTSMQITLAFEGDDVSRIRASEDVEGDLKTLKADQTRPILQGFDWRLVDRPKREQLLDSEVLKALKGFGPS